MNNVMMVLVFFLSIAMHEFGHWWWFYYHKNKSVKIWFREGAFAVGYFEKDYIGLTIDERKSLFWYGIIIGMFPIYFLMIFDLSYAWVLALYLIGCRTDFMQLRRLYFE